jgi:hypothetical protein
VYKVQRDLDFKVFDYFYYEGQVVFVEGLIKGDIINVRNIINKFIPPKYKLKKDFIKLFYKESSPFVTYVLNGPFTSKENGDYTFFYETLKMIAREGINTLILNGPFMSYDNPFFNEDDNVLFKDVTFESFLEQILIEVLNIFINNNTVIVICPHLGDINNNYPLPQPIFNLEEMPNLTKHQMYLTGRIKLISNPSLFQLNESIVGNINCDVLRDIITSSIKPSELKPKIYAMNEIIYQKSFCPVLPSLITEETKQKTEKTTILNIEQLDKLSINPSLPDIMILNSTIKYSCDIVCNTLMINPGQLFNGNKLGSFGRLVVAPPSEYSSTDILSRIKVDIIHLKNE